MSLHKECKVLLTAPKYTYSYKDIRFETLSNVERMVIDESPSSLSSLAVMQMDDDLPVHLNVYISTLSNGHVKKYKKISRWFYYRIPSLRRDGNAYIQLLIAWWS